MPADLTNLFQAILTRYRLFRGPTDAYTLTAGRMYRTMAPARANFPLIILTQVGGVLLETFQDGALEDVSMQMSIFDKFPNDASRASGIMQSLVGIFDRCELFIPSEEIYVGMRREGLQREVIEDQTHIHISQDWLIMRHVPAWR